VGAPRTIADDEVEAVVVKTLETKPKGRTHWSTRKMAANVGLSHSSIGRIWRSRTCRRRTSCRMIRSSCRRSVTSSAFT
jgi:hypothetical protein